MPITPDASVVSQQQAEAQQAWMKTNALAALAKAYGPQYGDPASVDVASQAQTRQATLPYAGQTAAADVAKTQAETAQTQATTQTDQTKLAGQRAIMTARYLQSMGDPTTGDVDPGVAKGVVSNPALQRMLGIDQSTADSLLPQISGPGSGARLKGMVNAGMGQTGMMLSGPATVSVGPDGQTFINRQTKGGENEQIPLGQGQTTAPVMNAQSNQQRVQQGAQRVAQGWAGLGIRQENANTAQFNADVHSNNTTYGASGQVQLAPTESNVQKFITSAIPGATITSGQRTPDHNAAVGGVPNSQHISGTAVDIVLPQGTSAADVRDTLRAAGLPMTEFLDEGDHVHVGWGPKNGQPAQATPNAAPTAQAPAAAPKSYIDTLPPKGQQIARGEAATVVNANTMLANTMTVLDKAMGQINLRTTGVGGSILEHIPGTDAKNLAENLDTVKAQVAQAIIIANKGPNGGTGFGKILQSEYGNFQKQLGAIDLTQSGSAVRFHLGLVRQSLEHLNQTLNSAYSAKWHGADPYAAVGQKAPGAAGGWSNFRVH